MGNGTLAVRVYYISFLYYEVSRQIGKLTPRPRCEPGVSEHGMCEGMSPLARSDRSQARAVWRGVSMEGKEGCLQDRKVARRVSAALEGPRDLRCGSL